MKASVKVTEAAERYLAEVKEEISRQQTDIRIVMLLASRTDDSLTYAKYARQGCEAVGIDYRLRTPNRLQLETAILETSADPEVHGIFVFFPVFGNEQDMYLRNLLDYRKDVEGLSLYWMRKLYANDRTAAGKPDCKAILPCTPLAIIKLLQAVGEYADTPRPLAGKKVTIFNRSEIVGRPLAVMLSNDGAEVFSFDAEGALLFRDARPGECSLDRTAALARSDLVITGVPDPAFDPIQAHELNDRTVAVNFSSVTNFTEEAIDRAKIYIPRVGPMTVAMCMRNMLRLYLSFHRPMAS